MDAVADADDLVLPVAAVTDPDGRRTYAVGVPAGVDREFGDRWLRGGATTRGDPADPATHDLQGENTITVEARLCGVSVLPPEWYVTAPETVEELGPTGAIVVHDDEPARRRSGRRWRSS